MSPTPDQTEALLTLFRGHCPCIDKVMAGIPQPDSTFGAALLTAAEIDADEFLGLLGRVASLPPWLNSHSLKWAMVADLARKWRGADYTPQTDLLNCWGVGASGRL